MVSYMKQMTNQCANGLVLNKILWIFIVIKENYLEQPLSTFGKVSPCFEIFHFWTIFILTVLLLLVSFTPCKKCKYQVGWNWDTRFSVLAISLAPVKAQCKVAIMLQARCIPGELEKYRRVKALGSRVTWSFSNPLHRKLWKKLFYLFLFLTISSWMIM